MKDFDVIQEMLSKAYIFFYIEEIEGEPPAINVPSPYLDCYNDGVSFLFEEDGSLRSIHAYKPAEDEM